MPVTINGSGPVTGVTAITGAGLDLITTQTFSAASSVAVENCFNSTYDNYRVVILGSASGSGGSIGYRMRVASADDTSNNYWYQFILANGTSLSGARAQGTSGFLCNTASNRFASFIDIYSPNLAVPTIKTVHNSYDSGSPTTVINTLTHNVSTAYTGISLLPPSGTITGSVTVYGYRKV